MQGKYPAGDGVRLRRACDDGQTAVGSGRLFVCAWCGGEVVVCSCCDRGQIYCGVDCAGQARRRTLRGAGRRCQQTRRGRRMHAARMVRYRAKLAQGFVGVAVGMADEGWPREIVTHHGSPAPPTGDLVADGAMAMPRDFPMGRGSRMAASAARVLPVGRTCAFSYAPRGHFARSGLLVYVFARMGLLPQAKRGPPLHGFSSALGRPVLPGRETISRPRSIPELGSFSFIAAKSMS
jgi:hypothetical protein